MSDAYKAAGVNLEAEHTFSQYCGGLCRSTFRASPYVRVIEPDPTNFRGPRYYEHVKLPMGIGFDDSTDGSGTKPVLTVAAKNWSGAGRDLAAMLFMDLTRYGRLALLAKNEIMVRSLGNDGDAVNIARRETISGFAAACLESRVVLYRGETAQLSNCISGDDPNTPFSFLWSGDVHGVRHPQLDIFGQDLGPDQPIIALYDPSTACNGISLIRKGFVNRYGNRYYDNPEALQDLDEAAEPCAMYDAALSDANGWFTGKFKPLFQMAYIAHNTGGGIEEKLAAPLFARGLSAHLEDLFPPPRILVEVADWVEYDRGTLLDEDRYKTWACGQRAFVILKHSSDVGGFIEHMANFGVTAKLAGVTKLRDHMSVTVVSQFSGKTFEYRPK